MRILIAEDDPVSRRLLDTVLLKWGYETIVCADGPEALAQFESGALPEIAILDWMMPECDGLEICRRIRNDFAALPIYILMLTAKNQRADVIAGLRAGADEYITKPFEQQELHARLQTATRIIGLQRTLAANVRDLEVAMMRLRRVQQAQKMEAIGRLASGIAHEINTPIQYVGDNLRFLQDAWEHVRPFLPASGHNPDLDFMIAEAPAAAAQSIEGIQRVAKIIRAMREFAHPSDDGKVPTDLNHAIETAITLARSEWKYVATVETHLDPRLPQVVCLADEIQQVMLNLIVNAAQAIATNGTIRISTATVGPNVEIRVSDTGCGIPDSHRAKIFELFFTTKDIGKGTGQGLAIAYSVITQQHNGSIRFESEAGKGTTFVIQLPIDGHGVAAHTYAPAGERHAG